VTRRLPLLPLAVMAVGFGIPLMAVLARAAGSPRAVAELAASPYFRRVAVFTLRQAALSTLFSVLAGLPGAWLVARFRFPGRRLMKSLTTVPFVLPPILAVLGFILVFGNSGWLNSVRSLLTGGDGRPWRILYSMKAIILAHVFYNYPITVRLVADSWAAIPRSTMKAARSLGAGPLRAFVSVGAIRLVPAVLTSAVVTFLYCLLSFAVVLVLGGGPEYSTIEVEVFRLIKTRLDFAAGSALSVVESVAAFLFLGLYAWLVKRMRRGTEDDVRSPELIEPRALKGLLWIPAVLYLLPAVGLIVLPLVAVAVHSVLVSPTRQAPAQLSLSTWAATFSGRRVGAAVPLAAVLRSMVLGSAVAFFTTLIAAAAARFRAVRSGFSMGVFDGVMALPLGVSPVILGFGHLIIGQYLPRGDAVRLAAIALVHVVIALPFAYRILLERFRGIADRIVQAARASGAGPLRTFVTVELPLARRALVTVAVFSLALSAGEMNSTIILAPGSFTTLPLAIYRMIGAYDIDGACVLGTILIAVTTVAFLLVDRYGEGGQS